MRLYLSLFCLGICLSAPAIADTLESDVRNALIAHDIPRLEAVIAAAQATALTSRDHSALRTASRRVFATTDPVRLATLKDWVAANPTSAPAWTALAEAQMWRAFALVKGWDSRQPGQPGEAERAALIRAAQTAATRANGLDHGYARAVQILSLIRADGTDFGPVLPAYEAFARLTADHHTMLEVGQTLVPTLRVRGDDLFAFCTEAAKLLPDMSTDLCVAETVLSQGATYTLNQGGYGDIETPAAQVIVAAGDAALPFPRLQAMLRLSLYGAPLDPIAIPLHKSLVSEIGNIDYWVGLGETVARGTGDKFYAGEVLTAALDEIAARSEHDSRNPWLLLAAQSIAERAAYTNVTDPRLAAEPLRKLWIDSLPYGQIDPMFWSRGQFLFANGVFDTGTVLPMLENAVVLSGNDTYFMAPLFSYLLTLTGRSETPLVLMELGLPQGNDTSIQKPAPAPEAFQCPMLRAARLYQALCSGNAAGQQMCNVQDGSYRPVGSVMRDTALGAACPDVAAANPRDLQYSQLQSVPGVVPSAGPGPLPQP